MANPKKPTGVYSKGEGASNFTPSKYSKTARDKVLDVATAAADTAETKKDRANQKSIVYAAGRKYGADAKTVKKIADASNRQPRIGGHAN